MRRRALAALAALAAAGAAAAVARAVMAPPAALAQARVGHARPDVDGVQRLDLVAVEGEYRPNVLHARAGAPLRLRVEVRGRSGCATRLLAPDLGVELALVEGGVAEASVPPARAGSYVLTCAERMVKGVLVLE